MKRHLIYQNTKPTTNNDSWLVGALDGDDAVGFAVGVIEKNEKGKWVLNKMFADVDWDKRSLKEVELFISFLPNMVFDKRGGLDAFDEPRSFRKQLK